MSCMNQVNGNGVQHEEIAGHCDDLYDMCTTKTDDLTFCEDLRQECLDCVDRYDDEYGDDDDGSHDGYDDDRDGDHDGYDDDGDEHHGACDDDRDDDDHGDYDDDDEYDGRCNDGTGGMTGTGGTGGMTGTGGTGGMTGTGGTGGMTGTGGTGGMTGTGGTGGMTGTGGTGGGAMLVSFAADIQPYFEAGQANCVRCHSGGGGPAGVNLDSYANILAGGNGFPLVVPGDSSNPSAALIPQLNSNHFNGPDDAGFVLILSQWIDEGALNN